jgi:glycosyltransferase involved in cell wall biosynthesis
MIYVCVPVRDEAKTAGLVLWKVRQVFTAFQREYQLLVCDDASTDGTREVLARYSGVLPLTVITHRERQGYARSIEELLRLALERTDRPKRDCAIMLPADFVYSPEAMEDMVKRVESGADLVAAEQVETAGPRPRALRWVRQWTPRLLPVRGVRDTISGFLALRLITLRQALRQDGERGSRAAAPPLLVTDGWCANAELLARLMPHARRTETVPVTGRYDLQQRPSRVRPWPALVAAWRARPVIRAAAGAAVALLALAGRIDAQNSSTTTSSVTAAVAEPARESVSFPIGEHLRYSAKYGPFSVGEATMEVVGLDTIRGVETIRFRFHIQGGALWYHLDQLLESWVGRADFRSRRYINDSEERGRKRHNRYEIFPDSGYYREEGVDTAKATVPEPLDDAAFLYWVRTLPLEVGHRYEYNRYFRPDRNPVIIVVEKKERISVAGRKFNAIVIRPIIPKGRGIFAEQAEAHLWLSDDAQRMMLAMQSNFSFGTVTLKLKEFSVPEHP